MDIDEDKQEMVAQFATMTGTDYVFARSFLEGAGWSLNAATEAFLGSGNDGPTTRPPEINSSIPKPIQDIMNAQGVDEQTARAISSVNKDAESGGVRAPIPTKRQRLFDAPDMPNMASASLPADVFAPFRNFEQEQRSFQQTMGFMASNDFGSGRRGSGGGALPELFKPPHDLLFHGSLDQAKKEGKRSKKWILVNIQSEEFGSLVLNRDLWSNTMVKSLVRENFIFFQHDASSEAGLNYKRFYKPPEPFPHVAVLDPRTGELLLVLKLPYDSDPTDLKSRFIEQIQGFLDVNSMAAGAPPPVARVGPSDRNLLDASEDDQLAAAIAASLQETTVSKSTPMVVVDSDEEVEFYDEDASDDEPYIYDPKKATVPTISTDSKPDKEPKAEPVVTRPIVEDEPPAGENVTAVTVRLSNGKRVKRRFNTSNTIEQLFEYVRVTDATLEDKDFDLVMYPNVSLKKLNPKQTLKEASVLNTGLNIKMT